MNVKGDSTISLYSGVPKNFPSKRLPKKKKANMPNTSKSLVTEKDKIKGKKKRKKKKEKRKKPANKNNL